MKSLKNKRGKIIFSVSILLVTCLVIVAVIQNLGIESGFVPEHLDRSIIKCAYKSRNTKFNSENVSLEFFYGFSDKREIEDIRKTIDIPYYELYFVNDSGQQYLIKKIEENLISEKYRINPKNDEPVRYSYNYSETYTVPKELLESESGIISFNIYGKDITYSESELYWLNGISFRYERIGDDIILSK